jgi:16S rRNA (guanine527-N7)-methyltransferase
MKGRLPEEEIVGLPPGWAVVNCVKLSVPGTDAERHLIALEKA